MEVKAPGRGVDPSGFTGHDERQWDRQRDLANLLYTNGSEWRLYCDGEALGGPVTFDGGPLNTARDALTASPEFEALLTDFLRWHPAPITSVGALVRAIAPLTLYDNFLEQYDRCAVVDEARGPQAAPWRPPPG